ncbi:MULTISPECIES: hypothetical protein [Pseudomonas]|jgi:hypothetical protein|uniref:hypothetical protein n=1 Tax=Pseudomonas TaxID=286 RepID=UPI0008129F65|nr:MULTISPECIES: hypothetical protein [Pseudomonas]RZI27204.1 hypothetical protein EUX53_05010 [Pseudomonas orientalis]CRM11965.1 hypothetical protein [Pseudomonas sp. 28 E 9]
MNNELVLSRNRLVSITSWLAICFCMLTTYLAIQAGSFDYEAAGDVAAQLQVGVAGAANLKWMMLSDTFGFYVLSIPAALYLWMNFKQENPFLVSLATIAGMFFGLVGAIGASILSVAWPVLTIATANATDPAAVQLYTELFRVITMFVQDGIWGRLEFFLSGVWYIGLAVVIWPHRKAFAALTFLNGCFGLLSSAAKMLDAGEIAGLGLQGVLYATPIWFFWLGVLAWKGKATVATSQVSYS